MTTNANGWLLPLIGFCVLAYFYPSLAIGLVLVDIAGGAACALAADAKLIVSGDANLLELKSYHGIPIHTASAVLNELTTPPPE